jgi:hypothetical protein
MLMRSRGYAVATGIEDIVTVAGFGETIITTTTATTADRTPTAPLSDSILAVADTDTTTAIVATTVDAMVITGAMVAGVIGNQLR